jgi:hypothetical protein
MILLLTPTYDCMQHAGHVIVVSFSQKRATMQAIPAVGLRRSERQLCRRRCVTNHVAFHRADDPALISSFAGAKLRTITSTFSHGHVHVNVHSKWRPLDAVEPDGRDAEARIVAARATIMQRNAVTPSLPLPGRQPPPGGRDGRRARGRSLAAHIHGLCLFHPFGRPLALDIRR